MVTQFSCSSAPTFIVTKNFAHHLFKVIGKKNQVNGIILNCEFESILRTIENPKLKNQSIDGIPFTTRLFPFKEMIKTAKNSEDRFILWRNLS